MDDISNDSSLFTGASIDPPRCLIDPEWEYTIRYWMVYGRNIGKDIDYLTANNPLFKDLIARTGITSRYFACTNCETPEETSFVNTFYNTMLYLQGSAIRNRVKDIFDAKDDVPLAMLLQDVNRATVRRVGDKVVPLQEEFAEVKNKITPRDVTVETLLTETEAELEKIIETKAIRIKLQDDNNAKKTQDLIDERWKSLRDLLRALKEITDSTRKDVKDLQGEPKEGEDPVNVRFAVCVRLDGKFQNNAGLSQSLGLRPLEEIRALPNPPIIEIERTYSSAARRGIFGKLNFEIEVRPGSQSDPTIGNRHKSSVVYCRSNSAITVAGILINHPWQFDAATSYLYRTVVGSVSENKSKRTTPTYT